MTYKHGVYVSEIPTSVIPPVRTSAGLPVVFGTAPINLATEPAPVNKPILCYTYEEAVKQFGYSDDWANYTLCEFIKSHFALFNVAPVVLVNVLDPAVHKQHVTAESITLVDNQATLANYGVLKSSVVVKSQDGVTTYTLNTDYTVEFDSDGKAVINRLTTGSIPAGATLTVDYDHLNPAAVTAADIIGGVDVATGAYEGLELLNKVFPLYRLVPGMVLAPGWSQDPTVAAVMVAKASNINGHFKCIALTDVPTGTVKNYTDVAAWKNDNNYTSARQVVCWPKVKLGEEKYHLSTQLAGVICRTDAENDDIPYASPSNKSLQANGAVLADGTEITLGPDQAAYLNGQGIITALNFIGGWKAWGNRTGAYPAVTDPKDAFLPIRRMFDWIANTLVLTFWQKVDFPINRRLVETIVDSANIWFNGLAARGYILGGRVEFVPEENPETDLLDGIIRFHVYVTPPSPAREIDFVVEYDPEYLKALFAA
ncbi:phage tail sheath family protein [Carboxydothermus pertinax]|uniref:Phage tail protein n=1 Tax=Carboxydothermus pertinax TaxID=870242 RepID=A0A1L8CS22_9THEO|nr:phage tail protein [Carboxydothermus pertinax]GAV21609.1 phage tail protein [Carboxydothermus pertinax]